jgi:hypothetical protein
VAGLSTSSELIVCPGIIQLLKELKNTSFAPMKKFTTNDEKYSISIPCES